LSFDTFYERHHGIRIAKIIRERLIEVNLFNKVVCFTTDGASNMRTMCQHLNDMEFDWIWCVGHRFHLTVNNAFGFWPEKKKNKKKKDNINNTTDGNYQAMINNDDTDVNNNINNNNNGGYDDSIGANGFNADEDNQTFWDDATKGKI
jgi:hypothetical protein